MRTRPAVVLCTLALAVVTLMPTLGRPAGAAPLTTDPAVAADLAAAWLASTVNAEGFVPAPTDAPDVSATIDVALALAAADTEQATFDRILAWLVSDPNVAIVKSGADDPGRIGYLLLLADAAGIDHHAFGGVDLEARLAATFGDFATDLYGAGDPTYDGVFRQSVAIVGLRAVGAAVPPAATAWLLDQQCGATPAAAAGGYLGYRADTSVDCPAPDASLFSGPDTNSTALAVMGLAAAGEVAAADDALDFLDAAQAASGGFPFITGGDVDPNSTALVIQAILAGGEDPAAGRWVQGANTPFTSLLGWQIGTTGAAADQGAFASPFSDGFPDHFATRQAVWGAASAPFPLAVAPFAPTTTTTAAPTTTALTTSTTAVQAVTVTPAFTG